MIGSLVAEALCVFNCAIATSWSLTLIGTETESLFSLLCPVLFPSLSWKVIVLCSPCYVNSNRFQIAALRSNLLGLSAS